MIEIQFGKHVRLICDLNIGDRVKADNWGPKLDGKTLIVTGIKRANSESGFMVKVEGYENELDSNWLIKI